MSRTLVPELKVLYPSITTLSIAHSLDEREKSMKTETTEETSKERLMLFLQENVCITKNEYIHLTGLTRHAAIDELNKFIRQGILRRRGISRSTVYINNIQH